MRGTFELHRVEDQTGISGTGVVAEGVIFDDGSCVMRWLTQHRSTAFYDNIETIEKIHGHEGKSKIVYTGNPFQRAIEDCYQDACENTPFASVGGLEKRSAMEAPAYITPKERDTYLRGYKTAALLQYGADWETCEFGWKPALIIPSDVQKDPSSP